MAMMTRELWFVGGASKKFWRIQQKGRALVVRFGRIGSSGAEVVKKLGDAAEASRIAHKLIAEKLGKGYVARGRATTREQSRPSARKPGRTKRGASAAKRWNALFERYPPRDAPPRVTKKFLAEVAKALGLEKLPPSYVEYICRFRGAGERRRAGRHKNFPRDISVLVEPGRLRYERELFDLRLDSRAQSSTEAAEVVRHLRPLIPFAGDGAGGTICWDPARCDSDGEMMICFVQTGTYSATLAQSCKDTVSDLYDLYSHYRP